MPVKAKSSKGRSRSSSRSPSRKGKKSVKKSGKKSRSPSPSAKAKPLDLLSPDAMVNGYYISHNAEQFLQYRGFGWETPGGKSKKKKGKGKKKKK